MGATADGKKELIAIQDGQRESEQSWKELLLDVQARGLSVEPKLAIGDGALGFWKALRQIWPATGEQRCWVHKTANVLDKLPKSVQPKAKQMLHEIYLSPGRVEAPQELQLTGDAAAWVMGGGGARHRERGCAAVAGFFLNGCSSEATGATGGDWSLRRRRRLGRLDLLHFKPQLFRSVLQLLLQNAPALARRKRLPPVSCRRRRAASGCKGRAPACVHTP